MLSYAHLQNNASNSLIHNPHRETETFFNMGHIWAIKQHIQKNKIMWVIIFNVVKLN